MSPDRDDLLDEVGRELSVDARADFEARVRAKVTEDVEARTRRRWWMAGGVVAAGATVAVALIVWPGGRATRSALAPAEHVVATAPAGAGPRVAEPAPDDERQVKEGRAPLVAGGGLRTSVSLVGVAESAGAGTARAASRRQVILPPGNAELWMLVLGEVAAGRLVVSAEPAILSQAIEIPPIPEIPPIVIPPLESEPADGSTSGDAPAVVVS